MSFEIFENGESGTIIKVIGVGGAGGNALNNMIVRSVPGDVEFIAINTDRQALSNSKASKTIQLGTSGLGAGSRPEVGAETAAMAREEIAEALRGANMVFITAGMGGGTGTGASPIIAEISQELGILTVAVVTKPFSFEGGRRMKNAEAGLEVLKNRVHSMIVILNDKLEAELGEDATMTECFEKADEVLYHACSGIAEIIYSPGLINVDFNDVRTVMSERGTALMGAAEAEGPDRAITAASQAIECPLLDGVHLTEARGLLVNITASRGLKMSEVREAVSTVKNCSHQDAMVVVGTVVDESMGDRLRVTVIATGLDQDKLAQVKSAKEQENTVWGNPAVQKPAVAPAAPVQTPDPSIWDSAARKPEPAAAPAATAPAEEKPAVETPQVSDSNPYSGVFGTVHQGEPTHVAPPPLQSNSPLFSSAPHVPEKDATAPIFATLGTKGAMGIWSGSAAPVQEEAAAAESADKEKKGSGFEYPIPEFLKKN